MVPLVVVVIDEHFDLLFVDADTVRFGAGAAVESHRRINVKDIDNDGDMDLLFHFNTQSTGIVCGDTTTRLTGQKLLISAMTISIDVRVTAQCMRLR